MPRKTKKPAEVLSDPELDQAPKPQAKAPKKNAGKVDLHTLTTDGDLVDIWERRMINPNLKPATPIRLKTPGMHLRWINLSNTGRYQRARYEEGWVPVTREELQDEKEIYGVSFTTEGWVCRGEKQQEMLMKIPEAVFKQIRAAKLREVEKSRRHIKENMQSAGAKHFGDKYSAARGEEIADSMGAFKGDVKFGTERVEPDSEDLEVAQSGLEG